MLVVAVAGLLGVSEAISLNSATFDAETAGKTVFIKFQAPWWGHCKKMKPDWDKLMKEFDTHASILVGDVDCTADDSKAICSQFGVKGYPTLKYGDPSDLQAYEGGRDLSSLQKHARGLTPQCSPLNIDLCSDEARAAIEAFQALSDVEIATQIAAGDLASAEAEQTFTDEVAKLQAHFETLKANKEEALEAVKASGVGTLKSVAAARAAAKKDSGKSEL